MQKTSQKTKETEKTPCHIHDQVGDWEVDDIRENVCRDLPTREHSDGKHYCLLHKPDKNKDSQAFQEIINQRLAEIDNEFEKIKELPEVEQAQISLTYDFRYVWFPDEISFAGRKFSGNADFRSATFSGNADFRSAKLSGNAYFISAKFSGDAYFSWAKFSGDAYFSWTTFSGDAYFSWTTFSGHADFSSATFRYANFSSATFNGGANFISTTFSSIANFHSATFSSIANFHSAIFSGNAYFSSTTFSGNANFFSAKIEELAQVRFAPTSFQQTISFRQTGVKGYLHFEAGTGEFFDGEYEDEEKLIPKRVLRETKVFEGDLEFLQIRADKPERISFNKVRLCPSWFVNADSKKFVFTDIAWENHKTGKGELEAELESLERRRFEKPHNFRLLTVSLRNLADNAESNNRYEEASNFRKSAFECERLERKEKWKKWRGECILCREFLFKLTEKWKNKPSDIVHWLYRTLSFYGESWKRAFGWLFGIWIFFAVIFWLFQGFQEDMGFMKSFGYSLQVMTLQKPEPKPHQWWTMLFYGLETILAPLQAALLVLAIRRKFLR